MDFDNDNTFPPTPEPALQPAPEPAPLPDPAVLAADAVLLRRSWRKIALFIAATAVVLVVVALRQDQRLFLFSFTAANLNATATSQFFSVVTYAFFLFTVVYAVHFAGLVRKRRKLAPDAVAKTADVFRRRYDLFDLLGVIPAFLAIVVLANAYLVSPAVVDGPSMEPTFYAGDAVLVWHGPGVAYAPEDVIIIDRGDKLLIKRLIGVPGDYIVVSSAGVFLDGTLIEPFVADFHVPLDLEIPAGFYFVLGDNREHSNDSRYFGLVPAEDVLGKVVVRIDLF